MDDVPPEHVLHRLRDIGWTAWDPIGLMPAGKSWRHGECRHFADEYDHYMLKAAEMMRNGAADDEVVGYLAGIEAVKMCLGDRKIFAAAKVAALIHAARLA